MKFRLRIARAVLFLSLLFLVTAVAVEIFYAFYTYNQGRAASQAAESETTRSAAAALAQIIKTEKALDRTAWLAEIQSSTRASRVGLVGSDGATIVTQPVSTEPFSISGDFLQRVLEARSAARWLEDGTTLQTASAIQDGRLFLIREVDLAPRLSGLRASSVSQVIITAALSILGTVLGLWLAWRLAVIPMKDISAIAQQAAGGDFSHRAGPAEILELDAVGKGLNMLLDHVESQKAQLEGLNRDLEAAVDLRTEELQAANQDLERQASALKAVNRILSAVPTFSRLQDLVDFAMPEIVGALGAESGQLQLGDIQTRYPFLNEQTAGSVNEIDAEGWGVPIPTQSLPPGRLTINFVRHGDPSPREERDVGGLLALLGQQLGASADRIIAAERGRENNRLMTRLIRFSERLTQHLDFDDIIAFIGSSSLDLSGADRGLFLITNQNFRLKPIWHRGISTRLVNDLTAKASEAGLPNLLGDLGPIQVTNCSQMPEQQREWWLARAEGIRSLAIIPLLYEGHLNAYLVSFYPEENAPGLINPDILEAFARQAATALENTRLIEAERRQRSLAEALLDVASSLSGTLDPDEIFAQILVNLERVINHDAASIMMVEGNELHVIRAKGYPTPDGQPVKRKYPLTLFPEVVRMAETGLVAIIPDTSADPQWVVTPETQWIKAYSGAPVHSHGNFIGVINLIGSRPGIFTPEQAPILQAFAAQVAVALENARQYQTTLRNLDETNSLYRALTGLLTAGGDAREVAQKIAQSITTQIRISYCSVALVNRARRRIILICESGALKSFSSESPLDGNSVASTAVRQGVPLYVPDLREQPHLEASSNLTRSEFAIPLSNTSGEIFAVISMADEKQNAFEDETRSILTSFSSRAALVLENAHLLDTTRSRFAESEQLRQATAALTTRLDYNQIIQLIADHLPNLLRYDQLCVLLIQAEDVKPILAVPQPPGGLAQAAPFTAGDSVWKDLVEKHSPLVLNNGENGTHFVPWKGLDNIHSWIAAPFFTGEVVSGAIAVGRRQVDPFNPSELSLLQIYTHQAGAALQNASLHELEQQRAITDPLTGLYNRRGFIEQAHREMERCFRFYRPISLLMADIDHFKSVNDTYGHFAGDAILIQLADTMRATLRDVDLFCRYGGEEFCLLLPESTPQGAQLAAERLRQAVEATAYRYRSTEIKITISIGVANLSNYSQTLENLIEIADRALMASKENGRNRVTLG